MAGAFADYLENAILQHVLKAGAGTALPQPAAVYLALFTVADPAEPGTGAVEVSGGAYARQAVTFGATSVSGDYTQASNSGTVTFPTASASWGTIVGWALYDAASGGNMLFHGALSANKTVNSGDTFQVQAGQLTIQVD